MQGEISHSFVSTILNRITAIFPPHPHKYTG